MTDQVIAIVLLCIVVPLTIYGIFRMIKERNTDEW